MTRRVNSHFGLLRKEGVCNFNLEFLYFSEEFSPTCLEYSPTWPIILWIVMHAICICHIFSFLLNLRNIIQRIYSEVARGVAMKILWTEHTVLFVRCLPNKELASRHLQPSFESDHPCPVSGEPAQTQGELSLMAFSFDSSRSQFSVYWKRGWKHAGRLPKTGKNGLSSDSLCRRDIILVSGSFSVVSWA